MDEEPRIKCSDCPNQRFLPVTDEVVRWHLSDRDGAGHDFVMGLYGLVVYEEHILQICEAFAGLPPGRADVLRRGLNKQKHVVIEEIRGEFFASALARGHSPEETVDVRGLVTGFPVI